MLYSVALVSAVHQRESAIEHIYFVGPAPPSTSFFLESDGSANFTGQLVWLLKRNALLYNFFW